MKVYIILEEGYEDGAEIAGVYANSNDAISAIRELRRHQDPDDDWLYYEIKEEEVQE